MGGRPYQQLMPVRTAQVVARDDGQGSLVVLDLELGELVEPDVEGLSAAMARFDSSGQPGAAFVTPLAPGFAPREVADGEHARVWNTVVDHLQADPSYRETAFLRLDAAPDPGDAGLAVGDTVAVRVECRAERLAEAERADARVVADAAAWSVEHDQALPERGTLTLERVAGPDDRPELSFTLGVRRRWAVSSLLELILPVTARADEPAVPPPIAPSGAPNVDGVFYGPPPAVREEIDPRLRFRAVIAAANHPMPSQLSRTWWR